MNVSQQCVFLSGSYNQDDRLISMFVSTRVYQLRGITTLLYIPINAFLHFKVRSHISAGVAFNANERFSKGYWAILPSVSYAGILKLLDAKH